MIPAMADRESWGTWKSEESTTRVNEVVGLRAGGASSAAHCTEVVAESSASTLPSDTAPCSSAAVTTAPPDTSAWAAMVMGTPTSSVWL